MNLRIISNADKGSGDWVVIVLNGDIIFQGHDVGVCHLPDLFDAINGFEYMSVHQLDDEQIQDWQEHI